MLTLDKKEILSEKQEINIKKTVDSIITNLPDCAVNQLLGGYDSDVDAMLLEMMDATERAMFMGRSLDTENLNYVENVKASMDASLKKYSLNYFAAMCLPKIRLGWRNLEWNNMIQLYPWSSYLCSRSSGKSFNFAYAFSLWRLYSYDRPTFYQKDDVDNANRKETCLITNTMTLAKNHMAKIREEIETNEIIKEKLNPNGRASLGDTGITTETGSILHARGKDGFIRGLHVGAAVVDDLPDESSIYSQEQREKLIELFRGTITPIVEAFGYLIVSGTPYAIGDLYTALKRDKRFTCFEYPIIFPDGRPLAPDRFTFEDIMNSMEELGTTVFSREYLVVPISDDSTIFPMEYLMRATVGMENIDFVETVDNFPIKLKRVVVGVDFAISGNIGADYTAFTIWGVDSMNNFYLLNYERQKGMSHNEQIDKLVQINRLYRPNKIVCESNGFQSILSGLAKERGLINIETFTTTEGNKKDLYSGLPSLSAIFERGQMKIPFKHGKTKEKTLYLFGEFSSISFRSDKGKLESVGGKDDCVMSSFMAINELREKKAEIKIDLL